MKLNLNAFGDCVEKIAARGRITRGEASQILQEVADRAEQIRHTGQANPFVKAAGELGAAVKEMARKNYLDAVRNATIRSRVLADVEKLRWHRDRAQRMRRG